METITQKTSTVFIRYAIPSVLGMLAISSASVVDGFFIGNYVGASGIAAINLAMPIFALLFGLALMLGIGSCVVSGKLLAEGDTKSASVMFSKTVLAMVILSITMVSILYFFVSEILIALGATGTLLSDTTTYITVFLPFIPFLMVGIVLDYFVKIDNRPGLAFWSLLFSALINIILDWFLIAYLEKGVLGAALATGISQLALIIILLPHFFSDRATIKFVKPEGDWLSIIKAGSNGASEFINETSVGITALIFNYIMLQSFGIEGVAAYAVINYMVWVSIMVSFGISDSLQPIISKNFGAKKPERINDFLKYAFISVIFIALLLIALISQKPEYLTELFLEENDEQTITIVLEFAAVIWPLFLFNGVNLVISAYFTAIHKPIQSGIIALSRSLVLPVVFIYTLPVFFGHIGIYLAIPVAEFVTMFMAIILYNRLTPKKLMKLNVTN